MAISNRTRQQQQQDGKLKRHTVIIRRKVATAIAFATTILLICIENAKSFTTYSKLAKQLKLSPSKLGFRPLFDDNGFEEMEMIDAVGALLGVDFSSVHTPQREVSASTSLRMMPGAVASSTSPPLMLDMKTSINAFGGWYNKLEPLARPSVYYKDDVTDYTLFASPSDNWPASLDYDDEDEDDGYMPAASSLNRSTRMAPEKSNPGPLRTIRRIASWVFSIRPMQRMGGNI